MSMKPRKKPEPVAGNGRVWVTYDEANRKTDWLWVWPSGPRPSPAEEGAWDWRVDWPRSSMAEVCVEHWKRAGLPLPPAGKAILVELTGKVVG